MAIKKQKTYCIMCGKEQNGIEIKIDNVIKVIKYIKKTLFKSEKNNRLVVSKECYPLYIKNRNKYVSRQRLYITLGVIFVIFSIFISPTIATLVLSLGILLFLYLMSLLNYTPELNISKKSNNYKKILITKQESSKRKQ